MADGTSTPVDAAIPITEIPVVAPVEAQIPVQTPESQELEAKQATVQEARTVMSAWIGDKVSQVKPTEGPASTLFQNLNELKGIADGRRVGGMPKPIENGVVGLIIDTAGRYNFDPGGMPLTEISGFENGKFTVKLGNSTTTLSFAEISTFLIASESAAVRSAASADGIGDVVHTAMTGEVGKDQSKDSIRAQARRAKLIPTETIIASLATMGISPENQRAAADILKGNYATPRMVADALDTAGFLDLASTRIDSLIAQIREKATASGDSSEIAKAEVVCDQLAAKKQEAGSKAAEIARNGQSAGEVLAASLEGMDGKTYAAFMSKIEAGNPDAAFEALMGSLPADKAKEFANLRGKLAGAGGIAALFLLMMMMQGSKQ